MNKPALTVRLLVFSRNSEVLRVIQEAADSNLWQLIVASSARDAMEKLQSDLALDVLLADLHSSPGDGIRWLRWLRQFRSALPILLFDRSKHADAKLHAIRIDSIDYLVVPLDQTHLQLAITRCISSARDGSAVDIAVHGIEEPGNDLLFIGASPKMYRVTAQVAMFAESDLPVVISGEPGSGKAMVARLQHHLSPRSARVFAKVDCASLCDELLEREIFGYEPTVDSSNKGALRGKLELSMGGTLFLDHLEEMPLQMQSKLAGVIESGRHIRAEGSKIVEIDVRVLGGTSLPVDRAFSEGRIVPELLRQFGAREVRIPPLRERKEELPLLARHYMYQLSKQFGLAAKEFSTATEEAWQSYKWPGNLRELKESVKQFLIEGGTGGNAQKIAPTRERETTQTFQSEGPLPGLVSSANHQPATDIRCCKSLRSIIRSVREEAERAAIGSALESTGWNRKAAARLLKVSYRSILYKIEQYQMSAPDPVKTSIPGRLSIETLNPAPATAKAHWA